MSYWENGLGKRIVSTTCADGIEDIPGIYKCALCNPKDLAMPLFNRSTLTIKHCLISANVARLFAGSQQRQVRFWLFFDH